VPPTSLASQAAGRATGTARVRLGDLAAAGLPSLEAPGSGRVPNYLRALASKPAAAKALATVVPAVLFGGTLTPATKLAMAYRVAQLQNSPYVAAHADRMLRALPDGTARRRALQDSRLDGLPAADRLALRYAELLTTDIHGVDDQTFKAVRGEFNDAQVVELTIVTAFFNYLTKVQ
jgi:alkylhydroperoxidase family enzyme